jgi:hypothetical protein
VAVAIAHALAVFVVQVAMPAHRHVGRIDPVTKLGSGDKRECRRASASSQARSLICPVWGIASGRASFAMTYFLLVLLLVALFPRLLNVLGALVWILALLIFWHWPAAAAL